LIAESPSGTTITNTSAAALAGIASEGAIGTITSSGGFTYTGSNGWEVTRNDDGAFAEPVKSN
ncbi:MAG TPA: hypothetical protein VFD03_07810, partial [Clostridia bacterium]|nr:hypothetical protein [Clostridia bacterium]